MQKLEAAQRAFIGTIRDPDSFPTPADVEERRMAVYRELFYNNVEDFLANTFPVLKELMGDKRWHVLVRKYFANHRSTTPLFMQMPREFLDYLENNYEPEVNDFPFMLELAHYEWVELALATSDVEISMSGIDANGDLLNGKPVVSPLAWVLGYRYAVQRIGPNYIPGAGDQQETHLVVMRDRNDEVQFIEINQVTAALLARLQLESRSTKDVLLEIAAELNHANPEKIIEFGLSILNEMQGRGVVLGTRI